MFDYWSQASLGQTSLSGTTLFPVDTANTQNGWYQLTAQPNGRGNLSWYTSQPGQARFPIWNDCVSNAESKGAKFDGFWGIIVVTNGQHDDSALRDGQECSPPSSSIKVACLVLNYTNLYPSDAGHEMGHGYGLFHGRDTRDPTNWYTNAYDIMSWASHAKPFIAGTLGVPCPEPGRLHGKPAVTGPGLNALNVEKLGWMSEDRIYNYNGLAHIRLAPLEAPNETGYLMARTSTDVPYYTIEYRRKAGVDEGLPDKIVLVHKVQIDANASEGGGRCTNSICFHLVDDGGTTSNGPELKQGDTFQTSDGFGLYVDSTGDTAVVDICGPCDGGSCPCVGLGARCSEQPTNCCAQPNGQYAVCSSTGFCAGPTPSSTCFGSQPPNNCHPPHLYRCCGEQDGYVCGTRCP
jgi:M6 family metalloprotease-like protein